MQFESKKKNPEIFPEDAKPSKAAEQTKTIQKTAQNITCTPRNTFKMKQETKK